MAKIVHVECQDNNGVEKIVMAREISDYLSDLAMSPQEIIGITELLMEAFGFNKVTSNLIAEMMHEQAWSMRKARDAVKHALSTVKYKPKASDIMSYDKGIRFYSYNQMLEFDTGGRGFKRVRIPGIPHIKNDGSGQDIGWWVKADELLPDTWEEI